MIYKTFGDSSLKVSRIGLGMAALGRPGYITLDHGKDLFFDYTESRMEQQAHQLLDFAWSAGIRYFDAARSYGKGEVFLGNWLQKQNRSFDEWVVGSKWGYTYTAGWQVEAENHEIKDHSLPVLQRQWKESVASLHQYPDLYQIHSATLESGVLTHTAVLNELARMKSGGILIGLSLSGPNQAEVLRKAFRVVIDRQPLFDSVQATWNLLERSAGSALQEAHDRGMGIIVKEAVANGRLTEKNDRPQFANRLKILAQEAQRLETSPDALALAAVLAQPWADIVLSGATLPAQLQSNVHSLSVKWDEPAEEKLRELIQSPEEYWQDRKNLAWN
ncbi:MAG: aldo/keto reductase [Bacteroidia bacterium]|nr:aldo/keto reductase [Bacteroidia bacterium]